MLFVFTLLLVLVTATQPCVYSQSYWLSNASQPWPMDTSPLNQPLCGVDWPTLMRLNTSQARETAATQWLLAFHQLCTAALNLRSQEPSSSSSMPSGVRLSVLAVFDSMERWCDNMSGWVIEVTQDNVLGAHLRTLIQYNHGGVACNTLPFSFTQSPQLFFMGYNVTAQDEAARQAELMAHIYKIQSMGVIYASFLTIFVIPSLAIYIVMLRNKKREYTWFKTKEESTIYSVNGDDGDDDDGGGIILDDDDAGEYMEVRVTKHKDQ